MADIYEYWLQHKTLHITQRHDLRIENPITDFSCKRCYPISIIQENVIVEFLKCWKILCKIETQIDRDNYTLKTVISLGEIIVSNDEEFKRAAINLVWSINYISKPHYKLNGIIYILWEIKRNCYDCNDEGMIYYKDNKTQLYETLQEKCELEEYGHIISNEEINERFTGFWNWITIETTAYDLYDQAKTFEIFARILYLEGKIRVRRDEIRELQKGIKFHKNEIYYPEPWENDYLTNDIEILLLSTNGFRGEILIENPNLTEEGDEHDIMSKVLFEKGLFVEKEDLIRLTSILDSESEIIYKPGLIKTFIENIEKDNGELKTILEKWIIENSLNISHDILIEDEENVIKTPIIPSSSKESERKIIENNIENNNIIIINSPISENSTRSNSPLLIMAARNEIREDIRAVMRTVFGIDPGVNLNTAPANSINATLTNMINPIERAAKIADLPLFYGGEQDANEWIRDFNNVYVANGYAVDQAIKLNKAKP